MKPCMDSLWAKMNAMPGPVWVFGGWSVYRLVNWLLMVLPGVMFTWTTSWMYLLQLVGYLLALAVTGSLIFRKPYAVTFAWWYAGVKIFQLMVALLAPVFRVADPILDATGRWSGNWPMWLVELGLWIGFMYYLSRTDAFDALIPREQRRNPAWWMLLLMAVAALMGL